MSDSVRSWGTEILRSLVVKTRFWQIGQGEGGKLEAGFWRNRCSIWDMLTFLSVVERGRPKSTC